MQLSTGFYRFPVTLFPCYESCTLPFAPYAPHSAFYLRRAYCPCPFRAPSAAPCEPVFAFGVFSNGDGYLRRRVGCGREPSSPPRRPPVCLGWCCALIYPLRVRPLPFCCPPCLPGPLLQSTCHRSFAFAVARCNWKMDNTRMLCTYSAVCCHSFKSFCCLVGFGCSCVRWLTWCGVSFTRTSPGCAHDW